MRPTGYGRSDTWRLCARAGVRYIPPGLYPAPAPRPRPEVGPGSGLGAPSVGQESIGSRRVRSRSPVGRHRPRWTPLHHGPTPPPGWGTSSSSSAPPPVALRPQVGAPSVALPPGRHDLQVIRPPSRGQSALAKACALTPALAKQALLELRGRVYAPTPRGPKDSRREIIEFLMARAQAGPLYPLGPLHPEYGAACLLYGGYRSVAAYSGEGKLQHVRRGHPWSDTLQLMLRDCVRATMRGLGPPSRAPEVRVELAAGMASPGAAGTASGPRRPRRAWLVAMWWLLREGELAGLTLHTTSVRVWYLGGRLRATLYLPITKIELLSCWTTPKTLVL